MIVTGQFQFLHTVNTAWLIKARHIAHNLNQKLTVKLLPGKLYSLSETARLLSAFNLVDHIDTHDGTRPESPETPALPDFQEAMSLLEEWYAKKINHRVFPDLSSFLPTLEHLRKTNTSIVTTNGCFDILHPGHIDFLATGIKPAHSMIVLINSDASIARLKGPDRPVHPWRFRASLLAQLHSVDYVVVFDEDNPLQELKRIEPEIHIKGGSYIPERVAAEKALLDRWNGNLRMFPMKSNYSTTRLLDVYIERPFPI